MTYHLIYKSWSFFAAFLAVMLFQQAAHAHISVTIAINPDLIKVSGRMTAGTWMYLTAKEYEQKLILKEFTPFDFVVVEDLPPHLEPFPFAGVITNANIPPSSHIERQADIAQFPLISLPNAPEKFQAFKTMAQEHFHQGLHKVQINKNHELQIDSDVSIAQAMNIARARVTPWKPTVLHRYPHMSSLKSIWLKSDQLESFGQKLEGLRISKGDDPELMGHFPDIFAVNEDFIERIMNSTMLPNEKISVKDKILPMLTQIQGMSFDVSVKKLNEIQAIIETAPFDFDNIIKHVTQHLDLTAHPEQGIRIRSSSRVENMIGAGVLDSIFLPADPNAKYENRALQIKQGIRDVMKSVFHPRAYFLRELFQVPQFYIGVGLGFHRSVDQLKASGVTQFWRFNGNLRAQVVAYPDATGGTSPERLDFETIFAEKDESKGLLFFDSELSTTPIPPPHFRWVKNSDLISILTLAEQSLQNWNHIKPASYRLLAEWGITTAIRDQDSKLLFFDIKDAPVQTHINPQTTNTAHSTRTIGTNKHTSRLPKEIIDQFSKNEIYPIAYFNSTADIPRNKNGWVSFFILEIDHVPELFFIPPGVSHYKSLEFITQLDATPYKNRYISYAFGELNLFEVQDNLVNSVDFLFSHHRDPTDEEFLKIYELILKSGFAFEPDALIEGMPDAELMRNVFPEHGIEVIDEQFVRAKDLFKFFRIPTIGTNSLTAASCQDLLD